MTLPTVEQNVPLALRQASWACIMNHGRFVMDGPAASLRDDPELPKLLLGY